MSELRLPHINYIVISGRLTRDVELKFTPSGTPVAKLSLAFDRSYQKNGEWEKETSYLDAVVWDKRGEQCAEYLRKGSPVLVEGYIKTRTYQDKNNNNRKITEIVANKVSFLEKTVEDKPEDKPEDVSQHNQEITDDNVPF